MAPPASRWPFQPFWELDGYDFGRLPINHSDDELRTALENAEFTSDSSNTDSNSISRAECSRRVCNNVAVLFRAMLYCKDSWPNPVFWQRVHLCSNRQDPPVATVTLMGNIFIAARRAFLRISRSSPNEAARLTDQWISFLDSFPQRKQHGPQTPPAVPWDVRYREWTSMRDAGRLIDAGQPAPKPGVAARTARPNQHLARAPSGPSSASKDATLKAEENEDSADDASVIELTSARIGGAGSSKNEGTKRKRPQDTSLSAKRRAGAYNTARNRETPRRYLNRYRPESLHPCSESPTARRGHQDRLTGLTPIRYADTRNNSDGGSARITRCEDLLENQMQTISRQNLRIEQDAATVEHNSRRIDALDHRLRTVEEKESARSRNGTEIMNLREEIKAVRQSVTELKGRFDRRDSYIRSEVRKQWQDLHSPVKEDQIRATERLDRFSNDLAVEKSRMDECQKDLKEHGDKVREHETELDGIKRKARGHSRSMKALVARVDGLEHTFVSGQNTRTNIEPGQDPNLEELMFEPRLKDLVDRVAELEKKAENQDSAKEAQDAIIERLMRRLQTLEQGASRSASQSSPKAGGGGKASGGGSIASLAARLASQQAQPAKQTKELEELRTQASRMGGQGRKKGGQKGPAVAKPVDAITKSKFKVGWKGSKKTFH